MVPPKKRTSSGRVTAKKAMRVDHPLCMNPAAAQRMIELKRRKVELQGMVKKELAVQSDLDDLIDELDEVTEEVRADTVVFVALAIGKKPWTVLKAEYPPTTAQVKEAKKSGHSLVWDVDDFPAAAFEACLRISEVNDDGEETGLVPLGDELIAEMFEGEDDPKWNDAELGELLTAILIANESAPRVGDLGNG